MNIVRLSVLSCCSSPTSFSHCFCFGNGRVSLAAQSSNRLASPLAMLVQLRQNALCSINCPSSTFRLPNNLFLTKFCVDTQCTPLLQHSSSCWRSHARHSSARRGSTLFARVDGALTPTLHHHALPTAPSLFFVVLEVHALFRFGATTSTSWVS